MQRKSDRILKMNFILLPRANHNVSFSQKCLVKKSHLTDSAGTTGYAHGKKKTIHRAHILYQNSLKINFKTKANYKTIKFSFM